MQFEEGDCPKMDPIDRNVADLQSEDVEFPSCWQERLRGGEKGCVDGPRILAKEAELEGSNFCRGSC